MVSVRSFSRYQHECLIVYKAVAMAEVAEIKVFDQAFWKTRCSGRASLSVCLAVTWSVPHIPSSHNWTSLLSIDAMKTSRPTHFPP